MAEKHDYITWSTFKIGLRKEKKNVWLNVVNLCKQDNKTDKNVIENYPGMSNGIEVTLQSVQTIIYLLQNKLYLIG